MLNISNKQDYQYRLIIYDLPGNMIIDGVFRGNASIDTSHFAQGYYEIIISYNDETIRQKLIKI